MSEPEPRGPLWFVTGGARSGKSTFAERLAREHGGPTTYIATMYPPVPGDADHPPDEELRLRITHHREARPPAWETVEAPLHLTEAVRAVPPGTTVLIDCLSLWVTNRLLAAAAPDDAEAPAETMAAATIAALEAELEAEIGALLTAAAGRTAPLIFVTNEVGGGIVPPTVLGRAFRDLLGRVNQRASLGADRAWLLVAGRPLELPPPPPRSPAG